MVLARKLNKRKLLLCVFILIGVIVTTNVMAAWLASINANAVYHITSEQDGGFSTLVQLNDGTFITSNDAFSDSQQFSFDYDSANTTMVLEVSAIKSRTNSSCTVWQDDCDVYLRDVLNNTITVVDTYYLDNNYVVYNGRNDLNISVSCKAHSCPQDIAINITITKMQ